MIVTTQRVRSALIAAGAAAIAIVIARPEAPAPEPVVPDYGCVLRALRLRSIVVVLDHSASMVGASLDRAKAATTALIGRLGAIDGFALVSFSSTSTVVVPMTPVSDVSRSAIDHITADGGTCISCGLAAGAEQLALGPVTEGHLLLISDGHALEGMRDPAELAALAAGIAARGASISTVAIGPDADVETLGKIAVAGHGTAYVIAATDKLDEVYARELAATN